MGSISLEILNVKDYEKVMKALKPLIDDNIIRILEELKEEDSIVLPGRPITDEDLLAEIERAEQSPIVTGEEAQTFFNHLIESSKKA